MRLSLMGAWYTAMLSRQEKIRGLKQFMHDHFPEPLPSPQVVREQILTWATEAQAAGLPIKITRHAQPVM